MPDELHRRLKSRAALTGTSMSDYVLREIRHSLEKPTREDLFKRIARLPPVDVDPPPGKVLREARERR